MLISLDYDQTYTRDKLMWDRFIDLAKQHGHEIICFTMRYPDEVALKIPCKVVYTSRKAKKKFAEDNGYIVDIWIDDKPAWLFEDAFDSRTQN